MMQLINVGSSIIGQEGHCRDGKNGPKRGEDGLELYVMCQISNNVIQVDAFEELFDGFSIKSNNLTQLTLGSIATPRSSHSTSMKAMPECWKSARSSHGGRPALAIRGQTRHDFRLTTC
jgi:hypothetical protein